MFAYFLLKFFVNIGVNDPRISATVDFQLYFLILAN